MKPRRASARHAWLAGSLTLAILVGYLFCWMPAQSQMAGLSRALESMETSSYDRRLRMRPRQTPDPRIVIVGLDFETLEKYGPLPWSRKVFASFLDRLTEVNAALVCMDISFVGSHQLDPGGDEALIKAVRRNGRVVVARYADYKRKFDHQTGEIQDLRIWHDMPAGLQEALGGPNGRDGIGFVWVRLDGDRQIRRMYLKLSSDSFASQVNVPPPASKGDPKQSQSQGLELLDYRPLAVQAVSRLLKAPYRCERLSDGWQAELGSSALEGWGSPHGDVETLLDYAGRPYPVMSFLDVMEKPASELSDLKDKLVVVGSFADLSDSYAVPRNPANREGPVPGCFTHAALIDQLLSGRHLDFPHYPLEPTSASLWLQGCSVGALLCLLSAALHWRYKLLYALVESGALLMAYWAFACWQMASSGRYWNMVMPAVMLVVFQLGSIAFDVRRVRQVLRRFVPDDDVDQLMRSPEALERGSVTQVATILFVDIRDYTALSEKLSPSGVRSLVSQFHRETAAVFESCGGYICDFQGDAQMVAFGVAVKDANHAALALKAASLLPERVARLNEELAGTHPELVGETNVVFRYGVGLCTGEVSVGYLQSGGKLQHTVLGDTTNTAARLQGTARDLGVITVVSYTTAELAPDWAERMRPLKAVHLKGKVEDHRIFELIPEI